MMIDFETFNPRNNPMRLSSSMSLKFDRTKLLQIVGKNREKHAAEYAVAVVKHREKLIETLERKLHFVRQSDNEITMRQQMIDLPIPESHVEDYDRVLRMLSLTTQEEITLTQAEFSQLVDDEWEWAHSFAANTRSYANG